MKKKQAKKIMLSKETLRDLEESQVEEVEGGLPPTYSQRSCYNSCPPTCDC
jgi:hypothetical protein